MKNTKESKKQTSKKEISSVFKEAVALTKSSKKGFTTSLCFFLILTIACLCLAYIDDFTLILSAPFVIAPAYFVFFFLSSSPSKDVDTLGACFKSYKIYFNQVFTGSFKLIRGFLKALLAFFLSEIVVLTIFEATLFTKDAAYVSLMDQIGSANFDVEGFSESFTNLLSTNEYLGNLVFVATAVATCVGTFVFLRHVAMATIKIDFVMVNNQPIPMRGFAMIDKKVRKESHGEFRKDFFKATWFVGLMIFISFIIAGVLQFFVIKNTNINQYFVMGLLISLILISPFLNYMVEVYHVMFAKYSASYAASFASVTLELITKFKDKLGVDDKDAETIKKMLEDSRKDKKDKDKKKK